MSTNYYLRRKESVEIWAQARVLRRSAGAVSPCRDDRAELVDAGGEFVAEAYGDYNDIPRPCSVADLRDLLAGGRYELYDEYGERCELDEAMGE